MSSSIQRKRVQEDDQNKIKKFFQDLEKDLPFAVYSKRCRCVDGHHGHGRGGRPVPKVDHRYSSIPGMVVPPIMWSFVEEMIDNSDDKTIVVTNITREIREEIDFLKLFQPFGEVTSAKLAPINIKGTLRGDCGFVTFVNKEDAQQAIHKLNNSGPHGVDKRILRVNWAPTPTPKKST